MKKCMHLFLSLTDAPICFFPSKNRVRVKSLGMASRLANARPRAVQNLQMPHPRDWHGGQMPRSGPGGTGGGGGWAQVELIDA